jgi:hypothetical protein
MFESAIADVQKLEQSVEGKSLPDLRIRLALRSCLKELRMLIVDPATAAARTTVGLESVKAP